MTYTDKELNTPGTIYIEKFNTNLMTGIVANLLHCDYNVIITLDDDTGDYIILYCSKDGNMFPIWLEEPPEEKHIIPRYVNES